MTNHLLILFAYHYPPENASGAARPYRFAKYLRRIGYRVHVITASEQTGEPQDDVEFIPDPFLAGKRDLGWQIERAIRLLLVPGIGGMQWAHAASQAARRIMRTANSSVTVLSTAPPLGTHYAAWRVARAERIPWIADFRDPMAGRIMALVGMKPYQVSFLNWVEKKLFERADLVIANTDSMASEWKQQYPAQAHKIDMIWNGFDPEKSMNARPLPSRDFQVLSHTGELYAVRKIAPVLHSIGRLIERGIISAHQLKVRLVGFAHPAALPSPDFLERAARAGWLDLVPEVSQQEARTVSQTSDGLLLVQPQSDIQVPGKLFEYLQIGRPILAYLQRNSPAARILSMAGGVYRCVYADSSDQEMDDTIAEFLRLPPEVSVPSEQYNQQFRAENQAQKLHSLISRLHVQAK